MTDKNGCDFPNCPTKELVDTLKKMSEKISDYKVFESDIRYIRDTVKDIDARLTKDVDELFKRMREVENSKVSKGDLYAAVSLTGVLVGIISFIIQMAVK